MRILAALLAFTLFPAVAGADDWVEVPSADPTMVIAFSKDSVEVMSSSVKKVRTRFAGRNGQVIPQVNVMSVVTDVEFNCKQPLEKVLFAQIVTADGNLSSQQVENPLFSEIPHGSNSYRLWLQICSPPGVKTQ
ncbi:hypothetical protein [Geomonas sp.]|uniref:hypothetical protein n=1 Tax=Geomonas sp. TaxID=2651584 RepID=UPI002B466594|nr:hypothetical protein [Geomonas sp.]HJV37119.1 hypothetical protein [Geomonas sp.]